MCGPAGMMMGQRGRQVSLKPPGTLPSQDPNAPAEGPMPRPIVDSGVLMAGGIMPGWENSQSTDAEKRKVLWEIINKPGYDPSTVREAQKQWIQMQQKLPPA